MSAKKAGRPEKGKVRHCTVEPHDPSFPMLATHRLGRLTLDPTWTENLCEIFGDVMLGRAGENGKKHAGNWMVCFLENAPSEVLEELFRRLLAMRKESEKEEKHKGRNWHILNGYLAYLSETNNRIPSKIELRKYLLARPEKYRNLPSEDDKAGWTRAWLATGLSDLAGR